MPNAISNENNDLTMSAPPTAQETSNDPNRTLSWLQQRLSTIYSPSHPGLSLKESMTVHAVVSDHCRSLTRGSQGGHLLGEDLYRVTEENIGEYCKAIHDRLSQDFSSLSQVQDGSERQRGVLAAYTTQWDVYLKLARKTSHLLADLDRRWIKREIAESEAAKGQASVYCTKDLHKKIWMEKVLNLNDGLVLSDKLSRVVESQRDVFDGRSAAAVELIEGIRTFFAGLPGQDVDNLLERLRSSTGE